MKKRLITLPLLLSVISLLAQVGINTAAKAGTALHISGAKNSSTESDDVAVTTKGALGVKTATVEDGVAMKVSSTSQGFLPPRVTTAQRDAITNPANGLFVYNTDNKALEVNSGTPGFPNWAAVGLTSNNGAFVTTVSSFTQGLHRADNPEGPSNPSFGGEITLGKIKIRHNSANPFLNWNENSPGRVYPNELGIIEIASATGSNIKVSIGGFQSRGGDPKERVRPSTPLPNFNNPDFRVFYYNGDISPTNWTNLSSVGNANASDFLGMNPFAGDVVTYYVTTQEGDSYRLTGAMTMSYSTTYDAVWRNMMGTGPAYLDGPKYLLVLEKLR